MPAPGDLVLQRFRLDRPLASGAMGEVWTATVDGEKAKVAVKLTFGISLARAQREAEVLAALDHPNIVGHVAHGSHGEGFALVMELVPGEPLTQLFKAQPPTVRTALGLAADIADALAHAHGRGIVHRDVKAANVLVVKEGRSLRPVLIDFGIGLVEGSARLSSGEVVLGSAHTMPPEQLLGLPPGPLGDVYSLACLLFRMVAGKYPFHAASQAQVLAMHAHAPVPALADRAEFDLAVPAGLEPLLQRCLAKQPGERVADAADLARRLRALTAEPDSAWLQVVAVSPGPESTGPHLAVPKAPRRSQDWAMPVGMGLAVVVVFALGWWWAS